MEKNKFKLFEANYLVGLQKDMGDFISCNKKDYELMQLHMNEPIRTLDNRLLYTGYVTLKVLKEEDRG